MATKNIRIVGYSTTPEHRCAHMKEQSLTESAALVLIVTILTPPPETKVPEAAKKR